MDAKRFDELFNDIKTWVRQARRLKVAGDRLTDLTLHLLTVCLADRQGAANQTPEFLENMEEFRGLSDARALLYGLAIENACKARLVKDGKIVANNGKVKGLRSDHNVLALVKDAGYKPTSNEEEFLDLLAYQTRTLSKYPIAKDVVKQNEFTGRSVGARKVEAVIVQDIIVKVLKDQDIVAVFTRGYMTGA